MDKYEQFLKTLDDVDSAVFGGDMLWDTKIREKFMRYMVTWTKESEIYKKEHEKELSEAWDNCSNMR